MCALHIESQDLLSSELTADPYGYFEALRRHDPVHWNEPAKGWLHTRYADISDAMFDPRLSSDRALPLLDSMTPERREVMAPMLQTISRWMVVNDLPHSIFAVVFDEANPQSFRFSNGYTTGLGQRNRMTLPVTRSAASEAR